MCENFKIYLFETEILKYIFLKQNKYFLSHNMHITNEWQIKTDKEYCKLLNTFCDYPYWPMLKYDLLYLQLQSKFHSLCISTPSTRRHL